MERWKGINGWSGYIISSDGRIAKILKPELMKEGYCRACLDDGKRRERIFIHRLVAEAFIKNIYHRPLVHHINTRKTDNSVQNLEWCTHQENSRYTRELEKENNHKRLCPRLTAEAIKMVKELSKTKNNREIAKIYGVSRRTIDRIVREKT